MVHTQLLTIGFPLWCRVVRWAHLHFRPTSAPSDRMTCSLPMHRSSTVSAHPQSTTADNFYHRSTRYFLRSICLLHRKIHPAFATWQSTIGDGRSIQKYVDGGEWSQKAWSWLQVQRISWKSEFSQFH